MSVDNTYYTKLAAAHCRGVLGLPPPSYENGNDEIEDRTAIQKGKDAKLDTLYRFKRPTKLLPRVKSILGVVESFGGIYQKRVLDVASQRGALLWPLLDLTLTDPRTIYGSAEANDDEEENENKTTLTRITSIDIDPTAVKFLRSVSMGGESMFQKNNVSFEAIRADVTDLANSDGVDDNGNPRNIHNTGFGCFVGENLFDVVICSEILEHLEDPAQAAREMLRVSSNLIICTVPAKPDLNPEHIQLFYSDKPHQHVANPIQSKHQIDLRELWLDAGATSVKIRMIPDGQISVLLAVIIK